MIKDWLWEKKPRKLVRFYILSLALHFLFIYTLLLVPIKIDPGTDHIEKSPGKPQRTLEAPSRAGRNRGSDLGTQGKGDGRILGAVRTGEKEAVAGARVSLRHLSSGKIHQTTTSQGGRYFFDNLPRGTYDMSVQGRGYRNNIRQDIRLEDREPVTVDVRLLPLDISPGRMNAREVVAAGRIDRVEAAEEGDIPELKVVGVMGQVAYRHSRFTEAVFRSYRDTISKFFFSAPASMSAPPSAGQGGIPLDIRNISIDTSLQSVLEVGLYFLVVLDTLFTTLASLTQYIQ